MIAETSERAAKTRLEFERKYQELLPHYRLWLSDTSNFTGEQYGEFNFSARMVTEILETQPRLHVLLRRLAEPLDLRLNKARERDLRYPRHPVTDKQILKALDGIAKERQSLALDLMWGLVQETADEGFVMDTSVVDKAYFDLQERSEKLKSLLSSPKKNNLS